MKIKIIPNKHGIPTYATSGSAGFDITADFTIEHLQEVNNKVGIAVNTDGDKCNILPFERVLIPTGIFVAIPLGWQIAIRPRSGNSIKLGLAIINSPGTIDSDYRGEIGILCHNTSDSTIIQIAQGMKITQGILEQVNIAEFEQVESLDETDRGSCGFGSTDESVIDNTTAHSIEKPMEILDFITNTKEESNINKTIDIANIESKKTVNLDNKKHLENTAVITSVVRILTLNGFRHIHINKWQLNNCTITIEEEKYYVIEHTIYSCPHHMVTDDLNIYFLLGYLTYNNLMYRNYKTI